MEQGWVKLHRKSMESTIWKNPMIWFVWCWCLMKANHKDNKFPFNGKDIIVKNGSFIMGQIKAQQELPTLTRQNIRTALDYLKSTSRITIESTNKFSIITIVKWKEYQQDNQQTNQPLTSEQPATNQPLTTNKNVKNDNNDKKELTATKVAYGEFEKVKLTEIEYSKLIERLGEKNTILLINELDTYIASKNKKYSSHYATLLGWARKRVQNHQEKLQNKKRTII